MRIALPHDLGKEEVRRRLRERTPELADHMPGGMAQVASEWPSEDRMNLSVAAMGQEVEGVIDIFEEKLVIDFELPRALAFLRPIIENAVRSNTQKLLEKK